MSNYLIERYLHGQATAKPMTDEQSASLARAFMRALAHYDQFMSVHGHKPSSQEQG
jgi:hypothetical protein